MTENKRDVNTLFVVKISFYIDYIAHIMIRTRMIVEELTARNNGPFRIPKVR